MHRLVDALSEIDSELAKYKESESIYAKSREIGIELQENLQIYSSSEINKFRNKRKKISLEACGGYVAAEYAYVYPPGIPLIVPGERISEKTVRQIVKYQKTGFDIRGIHETGRIEVLDNG